MRKWILPDQVVKSIKRHIQFLENELQAIEKEVKQLIKNSHNLQSSIELLTSIPGVGLNTGIAILTELPEINNSKIKSLSALVGVAPMNNDSGTSFKKKSITGGRKSLRCMHKLLAIIKSVSIRCFPWHLSF